MLCEYIFLIGDKTNKCLKSMFEKNLRWPVEQNTTVFKPQFLKFTFVNLH